MAETLRSKVKQFMTEILKLKTQSFPVSSESPRDCAVSDVSYCTKAVCDVASPAPPSSGQPIVSIYFKVALQ